MPQKSPPEAVATPPLGPSEETQMALALAAKQQAAGLAAKKQELETATTEEYQDQHLGGDETLSPSNPQFYGR